MDIHVINLYRTKPTHRQTSKTGEITVGRVDCTDVNILIVILRSSFPRCYHCGGNGVKGRRGALNAQVSQ